MYNPVYGVWCGVVCVVLCVVVLLVLVSCWLLKFCWFYWLFFVELHRKIVSDGLKFRFPSTLLYRYKTVFENI